MSSVVFGVDTDKENPDVMSANARLAAAICGVNPNAIQQSLVFDHQDFPKATAFGINLETEMARA